jgi:predicted double-glycine peptidase
MLLKEGRRIALPFFFGLTAFIGAQAAQAQPTLDDLPPVVRQKFDDDCGLAALQMLLQRAGLAVTPEALLAGLSPSATVDALSAADLADMVAALDRDVRLEVGYLPLDTVAQLASREPVLVLLKPDVLTGYGALDHFVLIEGRAGQAYLIADPVLPRRVQLSDQRFAKDVHGKVINSAKYAMLLRLIRKDTPAAQPLPFEPDGRALRSWEQAYRLPRLLAPGKFQITLAQVRQENRERDLVGNAALVTTSDATLLNLARGLGGGSQISLSLAGISGSGGFKRPGEIFDLGRTEAFNAAVWIDHVPQITLPPSVALLTYATVEWSDGPAPSAAAIGADTVWTNGSLALAVNTDLRYQGELVARVTPSVSYLFTPWVGFIVQADIAAPYRIGNSRPTFEAQLSVNRQLSFDWQIGAFFNSGIFEQSGERRQQFGVAVTYGVPRRFRRGG